MAIAPYMRGLLDDEDSLMPSGGLLALAGAPNAIPQALATMAQTPPRPQGPVPTPRVAAGRPVGPMDVPPPQPLISPTRAGLLSGGIAALEANPGSAMTGPGPVIAAALKAGLSSYMAGKQQEQDAAMAAQQTKRFQAMLADASVRQKLGPAGVKLVEAMTPSEGIKYVEEILKRKRDTAVVGDKLVDTQDGTMIASDPKPIESQGRLFMRNPDGSVNPTPVVERDQPLDPSTDVIDAIEVLGLEPRNRKNFTPDQWAAIRAQMEKASKARATNVSTKVDMSGNEFAKGVGEGGARILEDSAKTARNMSSTFPMIDEALRMIDQGIKTGTAANLRLGLSRAFNTAGLTNDEKVKNTEVYLASTARLMLPFAKELRPFTDKDREVLQEAMGGNINWSPQALKRLLEVQARVAREVIKDHNARVDAAAPGLDPAAIRMYRVGVPGTEDAGPTSTAKLEDGTEFQIRTKADGTVEGYINGAWRRLKTAP